MKMLKSFCSIQFMTQKSWNPLVINYVSLSFTTVLVTQNSKSWLLSQTLLSVQVVILAFDVTKRSHLLGILSWPGVHFHLINIWVTEWCLFNDFILLFFFSRSFLRISDYIDLNLYDLRLLTTRGNSFLSHTNRFDIFRYL